MSQSNLAVDLIVYVASATTTADWSVRAKKAHEDLLEAGFNPVKDTGSLMHADIPKPPHLDGRYERLGGWLSARMNAIFEIWTHAGEAAVPELERWIEADYDWPQYRAVEILGRFAEKGIRVDETAELFGRHFNDFRIEIIESEAATFARVAGLAPHSSLPPAMATFIAECVGDHEILLVVELLYWMSEHHPEFVRSGYSELLEKVSKIRSDGDIPNTIEADGMTILLASLHRSQDQHRALALSARLILDPNDAEARRLIEEMMAEHPSEGFREQMAARLSEIDAP